MAFVNNLGVPVVLMPFCSKYSCTFFLRSVCSERLTEGNLGMIIWDMGGRVGRKNNRFGFMTAVKDNRLPGLYEISPADTVGLPGYEGISAGSKQPAYPLFMPCAT